MITVRNRPSLSSLKATASAFLLFVLAASCPSCAAQPNTPLDPVQVQAMPWAPLGDQAAPIIALQDQGRIAEADVALAHLVDGARLSRAEEEAVKFLLERGRRMRMDYSVTREELVDLLKQRIKDFKPEELDRWESEGKLDIMMVDGEKFYVGSSASNLFFRYPEISDRRIKPESFEWQDFLFAHSRDVRAEVRNSAEGTANPRRFQIEMTITVKPETIDAGEMIRCWMPYPQEFQAQSGVELLSSTPEVKFMNAPDYPVRSLYFEQPSKGGEATVFEASYTLTTYPRRFEIDPMLVAGTSQTANPYHEYFTREQLPHVAFSPQLKALAAEIVGEETNPAIKARLIYDYVSRNFKYSYAREYSTLTCIPGYVLENGYGDCGQMALLYITLCRISGVPARWQSGWVIYPQYENLHDWSEIYLAPYGWVPVDPDFGMEIQDSFENLNDEEREELRLFYFGGIDAYRIAVNMEHGYPHYPRKEDFRSDTVDFQRGELESNGRNIYFDRFRYNLEAESLDGEAGEIDGDAASSSPGMLYPGTAR